MHLIVSSSVYLLYFKNIKVYGVSATAQNPSIGKNTDVCGNEICTNPRNKNPRVFLDNHCRSSGYNDIAYSKLKGIIIGGVNIELQNQNSNSTLEYFTIFDNFIQTA